MFIDVEEINDLLSITGDEISQRGKRYFEQGRVEVSNFKYLSVKDFKATIKVTGSRLYKVTLEKKDGELEYECNCPHADKGYICKHIIASILDMYSNYTKYSNILNMENNVSENKDESKIGIDIGNNKFQNRHKEEIIKYYENLEIINEDYLGNISIVPVINYSYGSKGIFASFKIGRKRMYVINNICEFGKNVREEADFKYGKELEFKHNIECFEESSKELVKFVVKKSLEYNASVNNSYYNYNKQNDRYIEFKYSALDDLFNILVGKKLSINDYVYSTVEFLDKDPIIDIKILEDTEEITIELKEKIKRYIDPFNIYPGEECSYVLYKDKLYKCSKDYTKNVIPLLKQIISRGKTQISKNSAPSFCEFALPRIKEFLNVDIKSDTVKNYKAEKLGVKVFLDIDEKNDIVANIKYCYGDYEFNPFADTSKVKGVRNYAAENNAEKLLSTYKFKIDPTNFSLFLSNEEEIYEFLVNGINIFMEKFEVLVTDKLKNRQVINPKPVTMGVRIANELLELNIEDLGFNKQELKDILKSYKLKKKYYRLKDGNFINLESSNLNVLNELTTNLGISEKELLEEKIYLPKYRTMYLENMIESTTDLNVTKDETFKKIVRDIKTVDEADIQIPSSLEEILRSYQVTGFNWLKILEKYGFGGILADDMGLGKTIQVIALLLDSKLNKDTTSIVVCPSSLYLNWKNEISKFAPELKTLVISGSAGDRQKSIENILNYDVVITSYDLLKRDIENYKNFEFKYIIADEAQYIKNNNTQNSKALKQLKSNIRFALTGTPIENSLAELWSILDFAMPGYLFGYKKFKDEIETPIIKNNDKEAMARLQKLVAPFVLRRIKKDVLKELPEKIETIMSCEMNTEQQNIYNAFLLSAREELQNEIDTNGFENSKIKILALITRLRQICCHPSLFIDNYKSDSAKLEQCIEIVKEAVLAGHKILLFSGFTSMFDIIIKELQKEDISYYILTGKTKVDTRVEMVDEFNKNKDINVFLISLKAGGTGLNLTGADMVIHYDPWWNTSAQNQATDRAYRIGQKSNVQVYKLITQNSIEEKILSLQEKKSDLTNSIIKEGETFINRMNKDDILELFQ